MGILRSTTRLLPLLREQLLRRGAMCLAAAFLFCLPLKAGGESSDEYSLKAAFIYNFAKFIEWPDSAFRGKREFCIATLGRGPLDRELAALNGKTINGRSIVFQQFDFPEEAAQCQVLFINRSQLARTAGMPDALRNLPVMTIGDRDDFCKKGGMFSIENENGKLVFDVNYLETQRAGLKPNSQLLTLARKIYGRP